MQNKQSGTGMLSRPGNVSEKFTTIHMCFLQNNFIIFGVFMETFSTKMKPSKWPDKIEQDLKLGRRVRYVSVVIGFYYNNKTPYYNRHTQISFTRVEKFGQYIIP